MIKPYSECAEYANRLLPDEVKNIIFLEEELRSGGMGMNLSDTMERRRMLDGVSYEIIAVDDSFVDKREIGQSIYSAAHVDSAEIIAIVRKMLSED